MPRLLWALRACAIFAAVTVVLGLAGAPAASAQQSFNVYIGGFTPRGEDARIQSDVLVRDLTDVPLVFDIGDFHSFTLGADYLVGFGNNFEAGLGVGFHQQSVPSVYQDVVNSDGSEIEQTLKLRVFPFNATIRFLPLGRNYAVEPYVGAGVGVFVWRYSETGQWVDRRDNSIFREAFAGSGSATGPMILGGIRAPFGSWGVGAELRYQSAEGDLPSDQSFAGTKIDLGGFTYLFSVNFRF
jgi:Outer membrane protein beta-barrel domain